MKLSLGAYAIILSAIIGFLFTRKKETSLYLKILPYFLTLSFSTELIGSYLDHTKQLTTPLYNFFTAFEFSFYIWLISMIIKKDKIARILRMTSILYFFIAAMNIFFIQGLTKFHSITYCIGCILVIVCCLYYFTELFQAKHSVNIVRQPAFWICTAILFFYACSFPLYGLGNFLMSSFPFVIVRNIYKIVVTMNVLLYLMFSIAFLCRIKTKKSSPSSS